MPRVRPPHRLNAASRKEPKTVELTPKEHAAVNAVLAKARRKGTYSQKNLRRLAASRK